MQFGRRRRLSVPLSNPALSKSQRQSEGVVGVLISCAWRLQVDGRVVCSSRSSSEAGGEMVTNVRRLVDLFVAKVEVDEDSLDFVLRMRDEPIVLSIFCDEVDEIDGFDNYSVILKRRIIIVGPKSIVRAESRGATPRPVLRRVPND
jgi:hypothetical protein